MSWRVFYSYSHKDAQLREQLSTFLAPLRRENKIVEWYDRQIEPGALWDKEIRSELTTADLILFLVSADFLNSDYCFGVEVQTALDRLKRGEARVVPILLRSCLWEESVFSALNVIPIDTKPKPISSWESLDDAFCDVAREISHLVAKDPPQPPSLSAKFPESYKFDSSLDLVRNQVTSYARIYERTRQRMAPSNERTLRMEQIFGNLRSLATASYPLLQQLASSPSPGERLAAVSILEVFASEPLLPFLTGLLKQEKPFVCYHALKALRFAVNALDASSYPALTNAITEARSTLKEAGVPVGTDRERELAAAERELQANIKSMSVTTRTYE